MKKQLLLSAALLVTGLSLHAQNVRCYTHEKVQQAIAADPSIAEILEQSEVEYPATNSENRAVVTIPVVVHVIYRTTSQNISTAQVQSQITALNKDFRKLNSDTSFIPSSFQDEAADTEIEFCLAQRDPNGQATDGITRTQTSISNIGNGNSYYSTSAGGKDAWPRTKYLNIWVCEIGGGILGFAYPPGAATSSYDGVVIDYRYFGTMGTAQAPFNKGRTATHEIGHFFNLRHIWGDANCGTDLVSDTPTQQTANYGCPNAPYHVNACGTTNPDGDMFMNYMDYVDDACMVMFTAGQKARMQAALNSSTGQRSSLKTSNGCVPVNVGLQERIASSVFRAYPNPASDILFIESPEGTVISIRDISGRIVSVITTKGQQTAVSTSDLSEGIYFVSNGTENVRIIVSR